MQKPFAGLGAAVTSRRGQLVAGLYLLSVALLGYTSYRAVALALTHDEAINFLNAAAAPCRAILFHGFPPGLAANNHLLVSLYVKALVVFDKMPMELEIRAPSLLAHAIYLATSILISVRFASVWRGLACFLLLNINPFLLDFFSLARGYSLALAFELVSLYFLIRYAEDTRARGRFAIASLAFAALGTIANFAWLNAYLAILAVVVLRQAARAWHPAGEGTWPAQLRAWALALWPSATITALLLSFVVPLLLRLQETKDLYFGGHNGFWSDTVGSSISSYLYGRESSLTVRGILFAFIAAAGLLSATLAYVPLFRRRGERQPSAGGLLVGVLLFMVAAVILQHHLFGAPYPIERTALALVPLFWLCVGYSFAAPRRGMATTPARGILALLAVLAVVNFLGAFNLRYTCTWKGNADAKQAMEDLSVIRASDPNLPVHVRLGMFWEFKPMVLYYRYYYHMPWLDRTTEESLDHDFDYYYCRLSDLPLLAGKPLMEIKRYPFTQTVLLKSNRASEVP